MCFLNLNKLLGWKLNLLHKLITVELLLETQSFWLAWVPGLHAGLTSSAVGAWLCGHTADKALCSKKELVMGLKKCIMCSLPGVSDFGLDLKPTKAFSSLITVSPGFQIYLLFLLL